MPIDKFNPFRPGKIAGPGMFAGRGEELAILGKILFQTKSGNAEHFLLTGERGIGKSSLLLYLKIIAAGRIAAFGGKKFNMLVVELELTSTLGDRQLVARVAGALRKALAPYEKVKDALITCWNFIKRVEAAGVKFNSGSDAPEQHELIDNLVDAVRAALESLGGEIDGIVFLVDEADKAPVEAHLGTFVKVFTEQLTKQGVDRVCVGLAGVTGIVQRLRDSHESAPRVVSVLELGPLEADERNSVVLQGLDHGNAKNDVRTEIDGPALELIALLSEGYPHFIQQFAYSAFATDTDDNIDIDDVLGGAMSENGALDQLGQKYFQQMFFDQINVEDYRQVLRAIAQTDDIDGWASKEEIRQRTGLKETTLTNAIQALKGRSIILPKAGTKGIYRLPTQSFASWIRARQLGEIRGKSAGT